jgi:tetratricopeptide (TPR) repeat protein
MCLSRLPVLVLPLIVCMGATPVQTPESLVSGWLSRYSAGDHSTVAIEIERYLGARAGERRGPILQRLRVFHRTLQRQMDRWPPPIGAAVALEAAAAVRVLSHEESLNLLETGCARIRRSGPPTPFELEWHLAAFAVAADRPFELWTGAYTTIYQVENHVFIDHHYDHARGRFPGNAELALERGIYLESRIQRWINSQGFEVVRPGRGIPPNEPRTVSLRQFQAFAAFNEARTDPSLRAEASVRLGRLKMLYHDSDLALSLWQEVANGTGPARWRYLADVFTGHEWVIRGDWDRAEAAFRRALGIIPGAQSAQSALAVVLFSQGHELDAGGLASALIAGPGPVIDPWWTYLEPGRREWIRRLESVRRSLES